MTFLCYICKRFKSCDSKDKAKVIRKLHSENLSLFGKLLETSTARRKRLKKMQSNSEESIVDSAGSTEKVVPHSSGNEPKLKSVTPKKFVFKESPKKPIQADAPSQAVAPEAANSKSNLSLLNLASTTKLMLS